MHTLALLLLLLVVYATPSASQECPLGAAFCSGRHGAGCYDPIYAACHDGLVCSNMMSPCLGRHGAGCYNPAYATCYDGLVCTTPLQPCFGPHGARCYDPGRATCAAGLIKAGLLCGFRAALCSLKVALRFAAYTWYPKPRRQESRSTQGEQNAT